MPLSDAECKILSADIAHLRTSIERIEKKLDTLSVDFVTRPEFMPVRSVVYALVGCAGITLLAFLLNNLLRVQQP